MSLPVTLQQTYGDMGAQLAPDGIPLHFGDQKAEYIAGIEAGILLDRSHEGRLSLTGESRFDILNRISTNEILNMQSGEGRATIFTNANGRILDRVVAVNRTDESLLVLTEPGRGGVIRDYLQRNIFFNDNAVITDLQPETHQFALHGPAADMVMTALSADADDCDVFHEIALDIAGKPVYAVRHKPLSHAHWKIIVSKVDALNVWQHLLKIGKPYGLKPSGGLVYNALRIRSGVPAVGHELTQEYIPLEVGLWDEISFSKGCYTGQEIIARMESRERQARTVVSLKLHQQANVPADLFVDGKKAGRMTSSVVTPTGEIFGIGVLKLDYAMPDHEVNISAPDGPTATIGELLGEQPPYILKDKS